VAIGVASMRQGEAVLVSSVKSSLNTEPKYSILRSNNEKFSGDGSSSLPGPLP